MSRLEWIPIDEDKSAYYCGKFHFEVHKGVVGCRLLRFDGDGPPHLEGKFENVWDAVNRAEKIIESGRYVRDYGG